MHSLVLGTWAVLVIVTGTAVFLSHFELPTLYRHVCPVSRPSVHGFRLALYNSCELNPTAVSCIIRPEQKLAKYLRIVYDDSQ